MIEACVFPLKKEKGKATPWSPNVNWEHSSGQAALMFAPVPIKRRKIAVNGSKHSEVHISMWFKSRILNWS